MNDKRINVKKLIFIFVQCISIVLFVTCLVLYRYFARLHYAYCADGAEFSEVASVSDFVNDFYESEVYRENLNYTVSDVARFAVIQSQMESSGEYNPDKQINIGKFANRWNDYAYEGPEVFYRLEDLINWGKVGFTHTYQTFGSFTEMEAFFGRFAISRTDVITDGNEDSDMYVTYTHEFEDDSDKQPKGNTAAEAIEGFFDDSARESFEEFFEEAGGYAPVYESESDREQEMIAKRKAIENSVNADVNYDSSIPMLEVLTNAYLSTEGLKLEDYASSKAEYENLIYALETTASDLYSNYVQYMDYRNYFYPDNTNVRYYVLMDFGDDRLVSSNLSNAKIITAESLNDTIRNMGEYIYCAPSKIDFLTNTPISYNEVNDSIFAYSYAFPENTYLWIGIDKNLDANDVYSRNYTTYSNTVKLLPWIISGEVISLITFLVIFCWLAVNEYRTYAKILNKNNTNALREFDQMPIEVCTLFYVLVYAALGILYYIVFGNVYISEQQLQTVLFSAIAIATVAGLSFLSMIYSLIRRIAAGNLWTKSLFAALARWIWRKLSFIKKWFWSSYDGSGIVLRTVFIYIFYLIFNTFWACMLFFSKIKIVSFVILFVFDATTLIILLTSNLERKKIIQGIKNISDGNVDYQIDISKIHGDNRFMAEEINNIGDGIRKAVETSTKDERLKADLITNVSHDIKTPLTSIINYIDLIKRERIDNDKVENYIKILDDKSQRLKNLTMDLIEASKITSGNITLDILKIDFCELVNQAEGEFEEKFKTKGLTLVTSLPERPVMINADPSKIWRVIDNILSNVYKYALENTRVYLDVTIDEANNSMLMSLKNISKQELNIDANELSERFIRGDRSRTTEGSGLGLSIAKSLIIAHKGTFDICLDGDLFKVSIKLSLA